LAPFLLHQDTVLGAMMGPMFTPLPLLFKALLQGQKNRVFFFSGHLIYILQQERFRAFRPAGDI
jgi:hypothetical protein